MSWVLWIASHGPDRSHDTLNSATFEQKKFAEAFVKGQAYWRISRMEYREKYSPGVRTDEVGGVDVEHEVERVRQQIQYETGRRATASQALARWRGLVERRQGGYAPNPYRKRRRSRRRRNAVLTKPDFAVHERGAYTIMTPLTTYAKDFTRTELGIPPSGMGPCFRVEKSVAAALVAVMQSAGFVFKRG
jgi:hypothetical protein